MLSKKLQNQLLNLLSFLEGNYPEETECKQLYWNQELLTISSEGVIEFDTFSFPSVCACHILDYEWTISWLGS